MRLTKEEKQVAAQIMDQDAIDHGLGMRHVIAAFRLGKQRMREKSARSHRRACKEWNGLPGYE